MSNIGIPVEQGLYTLSLSITPEGTRTLQFYDKNDDRVNYCAIYGVSIHESICDNIPTCKVEVVVPYTWLDNQYLTDGTKISISLKINEDLAKGYSHLNENSYEFRLYGMEKIEDHGKLVHVELNGVTDCLAAYGDANSLNCSCTTSTIFNNFADKHGFVERDIDSTSDTQLWIANGRNMYQFLSYCCLHGYSNDTSAMLWAIDRNKKLYYKNIVNCFGPNIAGQFSQKIRVGSLGVPVTTGIPFGLNNTNLGAYENKGEVFQLVNQNSSKYDYSNVKAENIRKTSETTCVCKNSGFLGTQDWFPFDVGNHNAKYFKAALQNRQVLSTYSTFMNITFTPSTGVVAKSSIVPFFQAFHLFDTHNIEYVVDVNNETYEKMDSLTLKAMVESIDVSVSQAKVETNVKFVAQGLNTKGITN